MAGVWMGFQDGLGKTLFINQVDPGRGDYCGECVRTCSGKCIDFGAGPRSRPRGEQYAEVDPTVCLGCGACVLTCERQSISLVQRKRRPKPPRTRNALFARILRKKGRLMASVVEQEGMQRASRCLEEVFRRVLDLQGTLSSEYGVGIERRDFVGLEIDPVTLTLMRRIKDQFDPNGILNPDKVFPMV